MVIAKPARGTSADVSALQRIESAVPRFTPTGQRIAALVLEDPARVVLRGISQLAAEFGVTQPSLSRFAKSLGFAGFRELRLAIARDIAFPASSPDTVPDGTDPASELGRLAERCAGAAAIEVWAGPELQSAASELAAQLQELGIPAAAEVVPSHWNARAAGAADGTLCVMLAATAEDRVWTSGAEIAHAAGLPATVLSHAAPPRSTGAHEIVYFDYSKSALSDAGTLLVELDSAVRAITGSVLDAAHSSRRSRPAIARFGSDSGQGSDGTVDRSRRLVALLEGPSSAGIDHSSRSLARTLLAAGFDVLVVPESENADGLDAVAVVASADSATAAQAFAEKCATATVAVTLGPTGEARDAEIAASPSVVSFCRREAHGFALTGVAEEPDLSHRNALVTAWIAAQLGHAPTGSESDES